MCSYRTFVCVAWVRGTEKEAFVFICSFSCPAGKEKEVWERRWKILLPGGQTRQSLRQEEGDAAAGGEDGPKPNKPRPFDTSFWFSIVLLRLMKSWTKSGSTSMNHRWNTSTRSIRCRTGRSSTWWNLWVPCHGASFDGPCLNFAKPCSPCSDWTGAGVPSQRFNAQQPDGGDDSGLHALQTRAAAQPAERERRFWECCSLSDRMSSNWTSIRF